MIDLFRGRVTNTGSVTAAPGGAAILSSGWNASDEFEILFDEDRQEAEILPVAQATMASSDSDKVITLAPQTYTQTVSGENKIGVRLRFCKQDMSAIRPSAFSLLIQV